MTSITFGGGPSIEARRNFSNLKDGSQVPGYCGYIHQLKYNNGHTYGDQTHLLANRFEKSYSTLETSKSVSFLDQVNQPRASLKNELPKTTGGNKLTEQMIPGYTGYVPSRKFHFSDTYKTECDSCIDDFLTSKSEKMNKNANLMQHVHKQDKFAPIAGDHQVKSVLDNFNTCSSREINRLSDKREFTEPPIPGYTGHIPRIIPTELGLGTRYNQTTQRGLTAFKNEILKQNGSSRLNASYQENIETSPIQTSSTGNKRIYIKPGMIPKFTGYVHGRKFQYGNTYGNTTRELPVCAHEFSNFGVFLDQNPPKTALC